MSSPVGRERLVALPNPGLSAMAARRFLAAAVGAFALLVLALCLFNYHINVWGTYGDTGHFLVYNDRRGKSDVLAARRPRELPVAWVVGGSTAYPLLPSAVSDHFGMKAYSLATFWARLHEYSAWLRFLCDDLEARPSLLLVTLETWTLRPDNQGPFLYPRYRRRFLNAPRLVRHAPDFNPLRLRVSGYLDLLSGQQLRHGIMALRRSIPRRYAAAADETNRWVHFDADGSGPYSGESPGEVFGDGDVNDFYEDLVLGRRDPQEPTAKAERKKLLERRDVVSPSEIAEYFPGDEFDADEVSQLWRLVDACRERRIRLVLILLPVHPYFDDLLAAKTKHVDLQNGLRGLCASAALRYPSGCLVVDATDLRSFGGDVRGFHDRLHMKPSNGERLLAHVATLLRGR